ncbi:GGDEF domain-containing response regulator [Haliangium ochraceum]|uniref:Response regulator receiver protein n=1 Tax=Haliangium ochraceum (strain DSM 14365 / JCM 11303 / SMP-2) TaxID=502025 RepID=D0LVI3_HALO1|nr:response regulator [Haliangium ochraceum]ACY17544.1 response regulator receiver protein [Haliangium ochraceum DSM 14365]
MLLKKRILLAEDDDAIVDLVTAALEGAGFARLRAENGARALDFLRIYTPDMLVLDVMMPEMDGIEAAQHIREDELLAEIPILMLTALSGVENKIDGLDAGADAYLPKPFDLREFKAQINALLRSSKKGPARNPITNLPGTRTAIENMRQTLAKSDDAAVIHFDVREFDEFAGDSDFDETKTLLTHIAALFQDKMRAHFQFTSFLGHLGGGQFLVIMPREAAEALARDAVETFDKTQATWLGVSSPVESLSLAAAVVPVEPITSGDDSDEAADSATKTLAERMHATLQAAKREAGSRYVVWTSEIG